MLTRRRVLRDAGIVVAGAALSTRLGSFLTAEAAASVPPRYTLPLQIPEVLTGADISLTAQLADVQVLNGPTTSMWTFNGSFPGPTIRRPAGQETRVTIAHALPASAGTLTIHNHGGHTPSIDDGGPVQDPIAPGGSRLYTYPLTEDGGPERAAMQWYHDHTHHRTGRNVWMGLAGMLIIDDEFEAALNLPSGAYELPLLLTDRRFDQNNQLVDPFTAPDRESLGPHEAVGQGFPPFDENVGNVFLVNGRPWPYVEVEPRAYRLRVLNASGFRPYNLVLSNGAKFTQVGTEAGLLPAPVERAEVLLGTAERADLLVDFSGVAPGSKVALQSRARSDAGDRPHTGAALADLLEFRVQGTPGAGISVPAALRPLPDWADELSPVPDRIWAFGLGTDDAGRAAWTVNGRAFDHERVDARPEIGSVETWALVNSTPVATSHFIHIHDVDWVVLSRNGAPPPPGEQGLKETFRLDPGEVIVIGAKFTDHTGPYMLHCHMLDHEDHGMMTQFLVVDEGEGDLPALPDPLAAVSGPERTCVAGILAATRRRPGRPAAVRNSPGAGLAAPGAAAGSLICHLPTS